VYQGKTDQTKRLNANRSSGFLDLIHTDICGPFPTTSWNGQRYFISFIDDYSCNGYLYLLYEKSESLDMFKIFRAKVVTQLSKKISVSNLTVMVSTMADMSVQENNIKGHLLTS